MIVAFIGLDNSATSYSDFKAVFASLGGSRKTPVVVAFSDTTHTQITVAASFASDGIILKAFGTTPSTFGVDFPNAITVDSIATT